MNNLLPKFKTFSIDNDASKHKKWDPAATDIKIAKIPGFLSSSVEPKKTPLELPKIETDVKAPNERYAGKTYGIFDPSPLSKLERGTNDPVQIRFDAKEAKEFDQPLVSPRDLVRFVFRVINTCKRPIDLFVQRPSSLKTSIVRGNGGIYSGTIHGKIMEYPPDENEILCLYISTLTKITITLSGRHEVMQFRFQAGPIGMEVDLQYNRLLCTNIIEDSQASRHPSIRPGFAEVIAVNGKRVLSLEEFAQAVTEARAASECVIVLTMAIFNGDIHRLHHQYKLDTKTAGTVKHMLSNIMSSGIDTDHQHDIELPVAKQDEGSDDDAEATNGFQGSMGPANGPQGLGGVSESDMHSSDRKWDSDSSDDDSDDGYKPYRRAGGKAGKRSSAVRETDEFEGSLQAGVKNNRKIRTPQNDEYSDHDDPGAKSSFEERPRKEGQSTLSNQADNDGQFLSARSEDMDSNWDYATALENSEMTFFPRIVCVPAMLQASKKWGSPERYVQFSNFGVLWDLQVYWVDPEGAMILRYTVESGTKHVELISSDHVWVIVAAPHEQNWKKGTVDDDDKEIADASKEIPQLALVFKPSEVSLRAEKTTSLLWVPFKSITISQRPIPQQQSSAKLTHKHLEDSIIPHLHVQTLDLPLGDQDFEY